MRDRGRSDLLAMELARAVADGDEPTALALVNRLLDYAETPDEFRVLADTRRGIIDRIRELSQSQRQA
jgi:hypothetical protein